MKTFALPSLVALFLAAGCGPKLAPSNSGAEGAAPADSSVVPLTSLETDVTAQAVDDTPSPPESDVLTEAGVEPWIAADQLPWETWYIQYLSGSRIGFSHIVVSQSALGDNDQIRINRTDSIQLVRDGKKSQIEVALDSLETIDGRLVQLTETTRMAGTSTETTARLVRDSLEITTKTDAAENRSRIDWEPGNWGVLGVQAILMQNPMEADEERNAKIFLQRMNQVVRVKLTAGQPEVTSFPGGTAPTLLPVDVVMMTEDSGLRSRNWVNEEGVIVKTITLSGPPMSTFLVPQEQAERMDAEIKLASLKQSVVDFQGTLAEPPRTQAVYLVDASKVDPYSFCSKNTNQSVVSISARSSQVTVEQIAASGELPTAPEQDTPTPAHLASSSIIQSDDPLIASLATESVGDLSDPGDVALKLTRTTFEKLGQTSFSPAFASAAEAAQLLEGDCTQHAVLLVAMLRNRGIPARIASGLRVSPTDDSQMIFHMWTEAWLGDRWLPLDATTGGTLGVLALKMLDSPLSGENPYSAVLPVFNNMNRIAKIRLVRSQ